MKIDIMKVEKGDSVRFAAYALRVEAEPIRKPGSITLHGRISVDGSPLVTKHFRGGGRIVEVRRG